MLEAGVDYDKLPDMWTIWILPYDPFGLNYRVYSVKNVVEEILEQKMKEIEQQMNEKVEVAEQKVEATKQEANAARQEIDAVKKLTQILLNEERYDDLRRITTDEEYLKKMLAVYLR